MPYEFDNNKIRDWFNRNKPFFLFGLAVAIAAIVIIVDG